MQYFDYVSSNVNNNLISKLEDQVRFRRESNHDILEYYKLDTSKPQMSLIEKFVYDNAVYQLRRINKSINDNIIVEFWTKHTVSYNKNLDIYDGINEFHVDKNEEIYVENDTYKYPIFSNVTYLNDSNFPFLLTDINRHVYTSNQFNENNKIDIIFPVKGKSITFDGSLYHGVIDPFNICKEVNNTNSRVIIAMNIWDNHKYDLSNFKNIHSDYYNRDVTVFQFDSNECINETHTIKNSNMLSYDFFNELLNNNRLLINKNNTDILHDNINKKITNLKFINDVDSNINDFDSNINDFNNLPCINDEIEHLNICIKNNHDIRINTRFRQRLIYPKVFSSESCKWIIEEAEHYAKNNGGWLKKRHRYHPTVDLDVYKIDSICDFYWSKIIPFLGIVTESYCMNIKSICLNDIFIVKYDINGGQTKLEKHTDACHLTVNIALNDSNSFEGGGVQFADGIKYKGNTGDAIVHSRVSHSGIEITKGTRYVLVAFCMIELK
jgi:hypothetical protein